MQFNSYSTIFISVNEFISNGELFQKVRNFPYDLIQIYVAELTIVLGRNFEFIFQVC